MLMTIPGLALFYGGMVRKKNMLSVLMQVLRHHLPGDRCCGCIYGYSLAFTDGGGMQRRSSAASRKSFLTGVTPTRLSATFTKGVRTFPNSCFSCSR